MTGHHAHNWKQGADRHLGTGKRIVVSLPQDEAQAYTAAKQIEKKVRRQHDGRFKEVKDAKRQAHLADDRPTRSDD